MWRGEMLLEEIKAVMEEMNGNDVNNMNGNGV